MESFINMTDVETSCNDEWTLLEAHLPGRTPEPIGVLLREMRRDRLHVRLKNHWWDILPEEDQGEIWHELANDLERKAREMGAVDVLDWLETTASHSLQISQRQEIQIQILDVETTLDSLFRQHIWTAGGYSEAATTAQQPARFDARKGDRIRSLVLRRGRKPSSSLYPRLTVAALAATLTVVAFLSLGPSHSIIKAVPKPERHIPEVKVGQTIVLPLYSGKDFKSYFLNIDLRPYISSRRRNTRKPNSVPQRLRAGVRPEHLVIRPLLIRVPETPAPPHIDVAERSIVPLPSSLPEPPKFKRRGNRFVHVLAVIATPFRVLAQ